MVAVLVVLIMLARDAHVGSAVIHGVHEVIREKESAVLGHSMHAGRPHGDGPRHKVDRQVTALTDTASATCRLVLQGLQAIWVAFKHGDGSMMRVSPRLSFRRLLFWLFYRILFVKL